MRNNSEIHVMVDRWSHQNVHANASDHDVLCKGEALSDTTTVIWSILASFRSLIWF